MKIRNSKALDEGVARASQDNTKINLQLNNSKRVSKAQPPGTALTAFLKRYKFDLLSLPCDNHISRLVDAADIILDEVGRRQA